VGPDGTLSLDNLPFGAGETVEVIILERRPEPGGSSPAGRRPGGGRPARGRSADPDRAASARAIAAYAAEFAGSGADLDPTLEAAALEFLRQAQEAPN